ncbi:hypothetical protein [Pseudonocardia sp. NPDC049635]|uniref:hypothetical protein n=1 Tax=Pseudonocardia sp. NPDC049635 TaxID=3155506 RepID=UPI0033DA50F7
MTDFADLMLVVVWLVMGAVAMAGYHRGTRAMAAAGHAHLVADYLMDRCGVTLEQVDEWHREQHPECFDDKPGREPGR